MWWCCDTLAVTQNSSVAIINTWAQKQLLSFIYLFFWMQKLKASQLRTPPATYVLSKRHQKTSCTFKCNLFVIYGGSSRQRDSFGSCYLYVYIVYHRGAVVLFDFASRFVLISLKWRLSCYCFGCLRPCLSVLMRQPSCVVGPADKLSYRLTAFTVVLP